ncbi:STAS-like domain-containing protein [Vibrio splendidus]|uniref:STAS-like domain-containing protein n=1 Tax=Vibrio splendidus TaxID=29497 RepID=UPI00352E0D3D
MSSIREIKLVDEFHPRPKGRYASDAPGCEFTAGEVFRKSILIDDMRNEKYDKVIVDLTGYNRYGRSFLAEAFGGLISREGLTKADLDKKLIVKHDTNQNFITLVTERIEAAEAKRTQNG